MSYLKSFLLLTAILFLPERLDAVYTPQDAVRYVSPFAKENERCFTCHSVKKYLYTDESDGKTYKGSMDPEEILVRDEFYSSNHKSLSCTDCHSSQFRSFPHPEDLKAGKDFNCLDCHGGDPAYAVFNFETIDSEFRRSVHSRLEEKGFTCWQCHDPHEYRLVARESEDPKVTVKYDNDICLGCHSDFKKFSRYSEDKIKISKVHKWLPQQETHFASVRCIECHGRENEKLLVAHYVMPEEAALRDCKKCHTEDDNAMASLLIAKPLGHNGGDSNAWINGLSLIGPNRNKNLDNMLLTFFGAVIAIMGIHIMFRFICKKI